MNLEKLPQEIRVKIKAHLSKINTLSSTELFSYSKELKHLKDEIGSNVSEYLFKAVHLRTLSINSGLDVKRECCNQKMIKDFIKDMK